LPYPEEEIRFQPTDRARWREIGSGPAPATQCDSAGSIPMPRSRRIEGYAIVSEDGMLANAAGIMPDSLKFAADRRLFESGLDGVDVVVHGRHSHERQPHSYLRRRLILTRQVPAFACSGTRPVLRSRKPWLCSGRQTVSLASLGVRRCSGFSWTVMTFSTCRGRLMCDYPAADPRPRPATGA
jgi:hypothetical protein